ncbi:MAG TPA: hypothetical protein DIS79_03910 [Bacteroidetes bacterium]|nr:hypothetical protein [Bacteroidota bacterium]HRK05613.1 hypothetical protein [Chlorobiota bacterium]
MIFEETQRPPRAVLILLTVIMGVSGLFTVLVAWAVSQSEPMETSAITALILACIGVPVAIIGLFLLSRMYVRIDPTGIRVRLTPFHRKGRFLAAGEIKSLRLRPFRPFGEFGGWGIRGFRSWKRMGYIWDGTTALDVELVDGRVVVISVVTPPSNDVLQQLIQTPSKQ